MLMHLSIPLNELGRSTYACLWCMVSASERYSVVHNFYQDSFVSITLTHIICTYMYCVLHVLEYVTFA